MTHYGFDNWAFQQVLFGRVNQANNLTPLKLIQHEKELLESGLFFNIKMPKYLFANSKQNTINL